MDLISQIGVQKLDYLPVKCLVPWECGLLIKRIWGKRILHVM